MENKKDILVYLWIREDSSFIDLFILTRLRDFIYDITAKYRYKIFGKMQSCRMPRKEEEKLFID